MKFSIISISSLLHGTVNNAVLHIFEVCGPAQVKWIYTAQMALPARVCDLRISKRHLAMNGLANYPMDKLLSAFQRLNDWISVIGSAERPQETAIFFPSYSYLFNKFKPGPVRGSTAERIAVVFPSDIMSLAPPFGTVASPVGVSVATFDRTWFEFNDHLNLLTGSGVQGVS